MHITVASYLAIVIGLACAFPHEHIRYSLQSQPSKQLIWQRSTGIPYQYRYNSVPIEPSNNPTFDTPDSGLDEYKLPYRPFKKFNSVFHSQTKPIPYVYKKNNFYAPTFDKDLLGIYHLMFEYNYNKNIGPQFLNDENLIIPRRDVAIQVLAITNVLSSSGLSTYQSQDTVESSLLHTFLKLSKSLSEKSQSSEKIPDIYEKSPAVIIITLRSEISKQNSNSTVAPEKREIIENKYNTTSENSNKDNIQSPIYHIISQIKLNTLPILLSTTTTPLPPTTTQENKPEDYSNFNDDYSGISIDENKHELDKTSKEESITSINSIENDNTYEKFSEQNAETDTTAQNSNEIQSLKSIDDIDVKFLKGPVIDKTPEKEESVIVQTDKWIPFSEELIHKTEIMTDNTIIKTSEESTNSEETNEIPLEENNFAESESNSTPLVEEEVSTKYYRTVSSEEDRKQYLKQMRSGWTTNNSPEIDETNSSVDSAAQEDGYY